LTWDWLNCWCRDDNRWFSLRKLCCRFVDFDWLLLIGRLLCCLLWLLACFCFQSCDISVNFGSVGRIIGDELSDCLICLERCVIVAFHFKSVSQVVVGICIVILQGYSELELSDSFIVVAELIVDAAVVDILLWIVAVKSDCLLTGDKSEFVCIFSESDQTSIN